MAFKKKVSIGLIGAGYWGRNILRNLFELNVLHAVCDKDPAAFQKHQKDFPQVHFTTSMKDVLTDPQINAVVIATPASLHFKLAKTSLLSGKDVFVEKPLALNTNEGKELIKLAESKKKVLMVGHILHYHPAIIRLKKLILEKRLGKIQSIYSNRLNIGKLRTEENIIWSFAPHDISIIISLVNDRVHKISASGGAFINKKIYDTTLTSFEFRNKIIAHVFVSWLHPFKEQKLVVVGSKGMAVFDDLAYHKLVIYPHRIVLEKGKVPIVHKADYQVVPVSSREPLNEELKHFIDCIKRRQKPLTDGREGLKVLEILNRIEKKLREE